MIIRVQEWKRKARSHSLYTVPVHARVVGAEAPVLAGSQKPAEERATTVGATPPIYCLISSYLIRKEMQSDWDINTIERRLWFPSASPYAVSEPKPPSVYRTKSSGPLTLLGLLVPEVITSSRANISSCKHITEGVDTTAPIVRLAIRHSTDPPVDTVLPKLLT